MKPSNNNSRREVDLASSRLVLRRGELTNMDYIFLGIEGGRQEMKQFLGTINMNFYASQKAIVGAGQWDAYETFMRW